MSRGLWRGLVVVLVIANLAYFLWPQPEILPPQPAKGVETLRLYQAAESVAELPPSVAQAEQSTPIPTSAPVIEPVADQEPAEPALTEVNVQQKGDKPPVAEALPVPQAPEPPVSVCREAGPLPTSSLGAIREAIEEREILARLEMRAVPTRQVHWVHIRPDEAGLSVRELRGRLTAMGRDSYEVASGDLKGSVSLGVFSTPERAQRLTQELALADLPAQVYPFQQYRDEFWLIFETSAAMSLGWGENAERFPYAVGSLEILDDCPW